MVLTILVKTPFKPGAGCSLSRVGRSDLGFAKPAACLTCCWGYGTSVRFCVSLLPNSKLKDYGPLVSCLFVEVPCKHGKTGSLFLPR